MKNKRKMLPSHEKFPSENLEDEWENETELNQPNLKSAMQNNIIQKDFDRLANIVYNMILKNVGYFIKEFYLFVFP